MVGKSSLVFALGWAFAQAGHFAIPVTRHDGQHDTKVNHARHLAQLQKACGPGGPTIVPETFATQTFWYASFTVGDAQNLTLAVDTGSSYVVTNPGLYKSSSQAINLDISGNYSYVGTQPDACGTLTIYLDVYEDTVSVENLVSSNQYFADTHYHNATIPGEITQLPPPFEGIVGFAGDSDTAGGGIVGGLPFFANLCNESRVDECRFGVAYGTSGKGVQVLGGVDDSLYNGSLSATPLYQNQEWVIPGNVTVDGAIFSTNQTILLDTGTPNVQGPIAQVGALFDKLGYQTVTLNESDCAGGSVIFGFYPCDSPPAIGFTVGSSNFNIEPAASPLENNGNNNCTSTLVGVDYGQGQEDFWLVGQAWMQGKYLDFDLTGQAVSAAVLNDPTGASL